MELEVGEPWSDILLAPSDEVRHNIKSLVTAFCIQVAGQSDCDAAAAAANVKDTLIGLEVSKALEMGKELRANPPVCVGSTRPDEVDEVTWRYEFRSGQ